MATTGVSGSQKTVDLATEASWIASNAEYLGLFLIVLMVLLVIWRAVTRQPVSSAEALIGIFGLIGLFLPVFKTISFEAFGVKLAGELQAQIESTQTSTLDFSEKFSDLERFQVEVRSRLTALEKGFPFGPTNKFLPGQANGTAPSAGTLPHQVEEVWLPKETANPAYPTPDAAAPETILIYYRDARRDQATDLTNKLLENGFFASATATDLVEAAEKGAPGDVRILYRSTGMRVAGELREKLGEEMGVESVIFEDQPTKLGRGDVQIQFF